jgi:hypothetical protein
MAGLDEMRQRRAKRPQPPARTPDRSAPPRPGIAMQGDDSQLRAAFERVAELAPEVVSAPASATITLPIGTIAPGVFVSRHVDVQLKGAQARAMRRLFEGLLDQGAKLANGRRVASPADAIRYVLEQLGTD